MRAALRGLCGLATLLALNLGVATSARAHPHAWIYVETTLILNDAGELTAIGQEWVYDNLLTEAVLAELRNDAPGQEPDVDAYAVQRLAALREQGYFMRVTAGGEPVAIRGVSGVGGRRMQDEIHLAFTAELARPVRVAGAPVDVKVFDSSYFIEILQDPDRAPGIVGVPEGSCAVEVEYPEPSPADYARALAIDSGISVEPEFGALFAERVHLVCL